MDRRHAQAKVESRRAEIITRYPGLWSQIISAWKQDDPTDNLWLMYSANYLIRTAGVHWAIDPLMLASRLPSAPAVPIDDLDKLSFVLLTHSHADHLDITLIHALSHLPIRWVVPRPLLAQVLSKGGISQEAVIVPQFGQPITLSGIEILPFEGIHWRPGNRGVPTTAYRVTFNDKRWLFPGDIRTYDADLLPNFGSLDGLIAHLWLGSGCALQAEPTQLDTFCRFCLDLHPRRVALTHLDELGREAEDLWEARYGLAVIDRFRQLNPDLPVDCAYMGDKLDL